MFSKYNSNEILRILDLTTKNDIYSVVGKMDALIDFFENDPELINLNPFLKTYYFVTKKVAERNLVNLQEFENFENMQNIDVIFASQFFEPLKKLVKPEHNLENKSLEPWNTFFEYNFSKPKVPFLSMLLGINAHINGDLAYTLFLAKAQNHKDFLQINKILLQVIPVVMKELVSFKKDIYSIGAYYFSDFTKVEFEKTVVNWRNIAWKNYQKILQNPNNLENYLQNLHKNTEDMGQQLINAFKQNDILGTSNLIKKINEIQPELI